MEGTKNPPTKVKGSCPFGTGITSLDGQDPTCTQTGTIVNRTQTIPEIMNGPHSHNGPDENQTTGTKKTGTQTVTIATVDTMTSTNMNPTKVTGSTTNDTSDRCSADCEDVFIICDSFNCHGFKQSADYIAERLASCDILCLTETWLLPTEEQCIKCLTSGADNFDYYFKSSMQDIDPSYAGRPYGGLALIVKKHKLYKSSEIQVKSNRVIAIALKDLSGKTVQIIICVYMPFYNPANRNCTSEYVEIIDILQGLLDTYSGNTQVKIVGDFNARLPTTKILSKNWYRQQGFTKHSAVLYDFILANDMHAMDIKFPQHVNFTFFCHARGVYTWIDHALCLDKDAENVKNCYIVALDDHNVSDHLPIRCEFVMKCAAECTKLTQSNVTNTFFVQANWSNCRKNSMYKSILSEKLNVIQNDLHTSNVVPKDEAPAVIEEALSSVTQAIHDSAKEAGCVPRKALKPKPFWCPDLSVLRDRKRFWWSIWVSNGRPRDGVVFNIYKDLKRRFRRVMRFNMNNALSSEFSTINHLFHRGNLKGFWNKLKLMQRSNVNSSLNADNFAKHYSQIMSEDSSDCTEYQRDVSKVVDDKARELDSICFDVKITPPQVHKTIEALNTGVSAGYDGVTAEHLRYGLSNELCTILADVFSLMLSYSIVPTAFTIGIIIPILKKSTLDPNNEANYRPITISSVYSKIAELLIYPTDPVYETQFGFQEGKGTAFVTCLINDSVSYFKDRGSPVYICSLDAEKCFDTIWHNGLMYKLASSLSNHVWHFLYKWYRTTFAAVRWNMCLSTSFRISKGMRQGSILSPCLFNLFLNDLMLELSASDVGVRILDQKVNSCAYADDVTLLSSTTAGLQRLIDICVKYACNWRFRFGAKKSKAIVIGNDKFKSNWYIGNNVVENVGEIELLGVTIDRQGKYDSHVTKRVSACRRAMFRLSSCGMSYPGLHANVKSYLWKSVGCPTLLYGTECIPLSKSNAKDINSTQGTIVKNMLGISKRSHHTNLLQAVHIAKCDGTILRNCLNFYNRLFKVNSPVLSLQSKFLSSYLNTGELINGTILHKIVSHGYDPLEVIFCDKKFNNPSCNSTTENGIVHSLRQLIFDDNYIKPWSEEYFLTKLLTKAF